MTTTRTVQDVFDEERKTRDRIEELEEEIEMVKALKEELKECKKKPRKNVINHYKTPLNISSTMTSAKARL